MGKDVSIKDKEAAAERAEQWATAGKEPYSLAVDAEKAALDGEIIPPTQKNIETTIKGALKLFLDGIIQDKGVLEKMKSAGLDMNNLRQNIVEKTAARAIANIINTGDIERLAQIGVLSGETSMEEFPTNAKKITRERVIIEIDE